MSCWRVTPTVWSLLTGCRHGEVARRLLAGDQFGARAALRWYAEHIPDVPGLGSGVFAELQHHLGPDDDLLVAETAAVAADMGLPTIVTGDAHYALAEDRELQDVLVAIRHGQTVDDSRHLRRHNGEYHLRHASELEIRPPGLPAADRCHAARLARGAGHGRRARRALSLATPRGAPALPGRAHPGRPDRGRAARGTVLGGCPRSICHG